jgi:FkbM family methyltransferase
VFGRRGMPSATPTRRRVGRRLLRIVVLVAAVASAAAFTRVLTRDAEYEWFKKAYGPSRYSEHVEEWLVRDFFGDERGGFFVDVGSYHYRRFSNTYYLEHALGWSGLAVDAQEEFAADYLKYRPRTRFFALFVSDHSDAVESFFVPDRNRLVASSNKDFSDRYDASGKERKVRTITLNDLLERAGVMHIDFLTMDIELAEPKALAGFDIVRHRPRLVCVEAHPDIRQHLLDYFADRQYRVVGRYLRADRDNLWFAPADSILPKGVHTADVP